VRQTQKQKHQRALIARTLAETWKRIEYLADQVPEGADCEIDLVARNNVLNVWAIEEEWIVDPRLRAELSMIQTTDKDE